MIILKTEPGLLPAFLKKQYFFSFVLLCLMKVSCVSQNYINFRKTPVLNCHIIERTINGTYEPKEATVYKLDLPEDKDYFANIKYDIMWANIMDEEIKKTGNKHTYFVLETKDKGKDKTVAIAQCEEKSPKEIVLNTIASQMVDTYEQPYKYAGKGILAGIAQYAKVNKISKINVPDVAIDAPMFYQYCGFTRFNQSYFMSSKGYNNLIDSVK